MIRLHLVGFTTDLKNLIFSRRKGAKSGNFLVEIDTRLRRTLEEVARLEAEAKGTKPQKAEPSGEPAEPEKRASKLSPKEIQNHLRRGKTAQEVARMAETDTSWVERFTSPILEERGRVVDAVKSASITKSRLGKSALAVGEAIAANLRDRRVSLPPEILNEGWNARLREGRWDVTFTYMSRGRGMDASFRFDPETRQVEATNPLARELAWRQPEDAEESATPRSSTRRKPAKKSRPSARRRRSRSTR